MRWPAWTQDAACRGTEPDLFFPVGGSGPALEQAQEAKAVCNRCPVTAQCLAWAQAEGFGHGIWGGLTEEERRRPRPAREAVA